MTIHTIVRQSSCPVDLDSAAAGATCLAGALQLLDVLGLGFVPPLAEPLNGPFCKDSIAMYNVGGAGTLSVVLVELETATTPPRILTVARHVRQLEPIRPLVVILAGTDYRTMTIACFSAANEIRHFTFEPHAVVSSDLDVLRDLFTVPGEPGVAVMIRIAAALDSKVVSARFFTEVRAQRDRVASAWCGIPAELVAEREQLSLLLLCRLMFLYFLQRQGHLLRDDQYLIRRIREWQRSAADESLYRSVLVPLFFNALNTRPEKRSAVTNRLGDLPYLNGGLFERTFLERRYEEMDLASHVVVELFDGLLEKFRFTASDAGESRGGPALSAIDPEMLGRVFEGLMTVEKRGATGSFYTPPRMVDLLTREALRVHLGQQAGIPDDVASQLLSGDVAAIDYTFKQRACGVLREVRILDPACGSGAFLLGSLSLLGFAREALGEPLAIARRDIVQNSLHGVDLLDEAALLCSLRLWLALADACEAPPPPLPNLDRRIRQGDSLLDPLELLAPRSGNDMDARAMRDGSVREVLKSLQPLSNLYIHADPEDRLALREQLRLSERKLAFAWASAVDRRLEREIAEASARTDSRDLWGGVTADSIHGQRALRRLRDRRTESLALLKDLESSGSLPFFSFRIHFAEQQQFNIVLSNPPWVRSHNWPRAIGAAIRDRYQVCRGAGQVDLSSLFVERSLGLLTDGGTLGMLLPAKVIRSRHAGAVRALLDRDSCVRFIDDYSLDQRSVFRADAFTAAIVATKGTSVTTAAAEPSVHVRMSRRGVEPLQFSVPSGALRLRPENAMSPWLVAPPGVVDVMRKMLRAGDPISTDSTLNIRRGVVTGANDVLVVRDFVPKLGSLCQIRAEGYFRARKLSHSTAASRKFVGYVETDALRPLLRGCDVSAWHATPSARLIWVPRERATPPHPRLSRYLARHEKTLASRTGVSVNAPLGAIMRVSGATLGHKVVWRDIGSTLCAAAVADRIRGDSGGAVPVIPLNTLYFVSAPDRETALLLSAYLNALPLRVFARAIAERAKDAHFRFFAWTIGMLPLVRDWRVRGADTLIDLSRRAHESDGMSMEDQTRLDHHVCNLFGLTTHDVADLTSFDSWLSGVR